MYILQNIVFPKHLNSQTVLLYNMKKDIICFRGERNEWIDFIAKLKKEKKEVWEILQPFIKDYLKKK